MEHLLYVVVSFTNCDDIEVQDIAYLDKERAKARVKHLQEQDGKWAWYAQVKAFIPVPITEEIKTTAFKFHPSTVYTPDNGPPMQVAYDAPRRVFSMPSVPGASSAPIAWDSLSVVDQVPTEVPQEELVRPSEQLELFPLGWPVQTH